MSRRRDDLQREALDATGDPVAAEALLAQVGAALDPVAPPPRARVRLMARIAGERAGGDRPSVRGEQARLAWWSPVAAALAAALIVAVLLRAAPSPEVARLRAEIASLRAAGVRALPMEALEAQAGARVQAFWDKDAGRWFIVGSGLKRMAGKDLQFWFITPDGQKIPSQSLDVHEDGCGLLVVTVPSELAGNIAAAAVTDEPIGGSAQPTGQIQLLCKL
ncbi:MAG TPA: anti-sigma factor [Planctomycetota bacterium]|nr:anti-sigma factor [Planctomycetota bacterium]